MAIVAPTVLVVDDETKTAELIEPYLRDRGYEVASATSEREALAKLDEVRPSLILLGVKPTGRGRWAACKQLRTRGHVPIVVLTARDDDADVTASLERGAEDCIAKPFRPRELVARIQAVLRRY
jgi:DNA-binding response OmpR family regulator